MRQVRVVGIRDLSAVRAFHLRVNPAFWDSQRYDLGKWAAVVTNFIDVTVLLNSHGA